MIKRLTFLLSITIISFYCNAQNNFEQDKTKTKVFFLAGQSNMDGRARAYNLTKEDRVRINKAKKNVTLYYNHREPFELQPTKVYPHIAKKFEADSLFGPELFFGIEMSEKYPNHKIVLIKRSRGGMSLYGAWNPDWDEAKAKQMNEEKAPKLYEDFIEYAKEVLSDLDSENYELCGMLWVQGETDSSERFGKEPASMYRENLIKLINGVRSEFEKPSLPFLIFQVGGGKVVDGMKSIAENDEYVSLIPQTQDKNSKYYFKRNPPPVGHYICESMKNIGTYFFEFYQKDYVKN